MSMTKPTEKTTAKQPKITIPKGSPIDVSEVKNNSDYPTPGSTDPAMTETDPGFTPGK